jgi:hypothetical protein
LAGILRSLGANCSISDCRRLPIVAEAERTPRVEQLLAQSEQLLEAHREQAERVQQLPDKIAVLKGQKAKPTFKPSGMESETETDPRGDGDGEEGNGAAGLPHASVPVRPSGARPCS